MDDELPWKYPRGFWCKKCHNTGYKLKNGRSCKDCWGRFAQQGNVQQLPIVSSGFRIPFTPFTISDPFSSQQIYIPQQQQYAQPQLHPYAQQFPQQYQPQTQPPVPPPRPTSEKPPVQQTPSEDPPPYTPTDTPVPPQQQNTLQYTRPPQPPHQPQPQPQPQYNQQPPVIHYPPQPVPLAPRIVRPGDPSMGGVLCGRCRGTGITHDFLLDEEYCKVCRGAGRVFR